MANDADPQCCEDWPNGHAAACAEMARARAASLPTGPVGQCVPDKKGAATDD